MKTFKTSDGAEWALSLTIDGAKRVRDLVGIDLLRPGDGEPPLMTRLGSDLMLVCECVGALIQPQAESRGVTCQQFGNVLDGAAAGGAAEAFWLELIDFFQKSGRTETARAISAQRNAIAKAIQMAETEIDSIDIDELVEKALGKACTRLPASSASTPAS